MPSFKDNGRTTEPSHHFDSRFPFPFSEGAVVTGTTFGKKKSKGRQNHKMSVWQRPDGTPLRSQVKKKKVHRGFPQPLESSHLHLQFGFS